MLYDKTLFKHYLSLTSLKYLNQNLSNENSKIRIKYKIVTLRDMNEKVNLPTVCRVHLQRDEMLVGTMASPDHLVRKEP